MSRPDEGSEQTQAESTRIEVVPLEALRIEPNQVLVLRLPGHVSREYAREVREALRAAGVADERVILMAGEVQAMVIE